MKVGLALYCSDETIPPDELAVEVEQRGFECLLFPDHSHIPTSRITPWPGSRDGSAPIPDVYKRMIDPFVALGAAAAVTTTLRIGTGVALPAQRDVLQLAKEVATVDWLSKGRMIFGIGMGWNEDEMGHHGVALADRWDVVAEKILRLAAANFPDMKFQLGISLAGFNFLISTAGALAVLALLRRGARA